MYGMVNEAIRCMIIETAGDQAWASIATKANVDEIAGFASFEQYDDKITLDLVLTTSEELQIEAFELLESFGMYWVQFAKNSEYSSILNAIAKDPVELIKNLNALHKRLELTFDDLDAPTFWVEDEQKDGLVLYYQSSRDMPLEYFVIGLVRGIFKLFNQECEIEIASAKKNGITTFNVRF